MQIQTSPSLIPMPVLTDDERQQALYVGERLGSELAGAVRAMPENARGGSGLSRLIGVDRATCQRIVQAARLRDGIEILRKAPGPAGIRQFLEGARGRASAGSLASLEGALGVYEQLVHELGGSQTRMLARLHEGTAATGEEAGASARAHLFTAAAQLVGRWSDVGVFLSLYCPTADGAGIDRVNVTGFIGHRAQARAMALTTGAGRVMPRDGEGATALSLDGSRQEGRSPLALMEAYCTRPLPRVTSRDPTTGLFQIIESDEADAGRAVDIVTARMNAQPIGMPSAEDPIHSVWMFPNFPSRHLLADVYMHRSLARRCIPAAGVQMTDMHHLDPSDWAKRFRDQPQLRVLGPGLAGAASGAYPRQEELTRDLFARVGWDPDQFVGYRCEVEYPIWRAGYCVWFDFSGDDE